MKLHIYILLLSAGLFASCVERDDLAQKDVLNETDLINYDTEITQNAVDAVLADLFKANDRSRSGVNKKIVTKTAPGNHDIPLYHVVNYDNERGFAIISAQKTYEPVIAYSLEGNLNLDKDISPALQYWLYNTEQDILKSIDSPADSVKAATLSWQRYIGPQQRSTISRVSIPNDAYHILRDIIDDSIRSWHEKGWQAWLYDEYVSQHPEKDFTSWDLDLEGGIYIEYMEDYRILSVVLQKDVSERVYTGPAITYNWHQGYPYNMNFPKIDGQSCAVGCVNIAGGLIMRHFRHPANIPWGRTDYPYEYNTAPQFLFQLSVNTKSKYGVEATSAKLSDLAKTMGETYGYNCNHSNFNLTKLNFPAIIGSEYYVNGKEAAHAWVVCAPSYAILTSDTEVWTFLSRNPQLNRYIVDFTSSNRSPNSYYINWGWGGNGNGYYLNLEKACPPGTTFKSVNEMIYNITPKK